MWTHSQGIPHCVLNWSQVKKPKTDFFLASSRLHIRGVGGERGIMGGGEKLPLNILVFPLRNITILTRASHLKKALFGFKARWLQAELGSLCSAQTTRYYISPTNMLEGRKGEFPAQREGEAWRLCQDTGLHPLTRLSCRRTSCGMPCCWCLPTSRTCPTPCL